MLADNIGGFGFLLLIAAIVALLAQRLHLPYTVGLVIAGLGLVAVPLPGGFSLSKDLILLVFLPPLIFEAALHLHWQDLKRDAPVLTVFATLGVVLSSTLTAAGMHWLPGWDWPSACLFGALISATDPVSVLATFKEAGVKGRLRLLMEAESLLNDGTAAVIFVLVLAAASGEGLSVAGVAGTLMLTVGGGILCGAAVAGAVLALAGKTEDPAVEIAFTTVAAYGSFLLAEHFHCSGILATLTAGLMVGNLGALGSISTKGREAVVSFWDFAAFVANSMIFILIGLHEAQQDFVSILGTALVAVAVVISGRAVAIYPCAALFERSESLRVSRAHQHVMFWGGLRGALALALALGLPPSIAGREQIVTLTFAVVAFSIVVQGMTMIPLLRRLGELPASRGPSAIK